MPPGPAATITRIIPVMALLLALLLSAPARAQDDGVADWSGPWETRWRGGGAALILEQDGATVTGTYPLYDGQIEARAAGRALRGRWIEPGRSGAFVFVQGRDGHSFTGRFGSGEWWTGERGGAADGPRFARDQSSPMSAMRSFLTAANAAVDGDLEAIGAAVALVRPLEEADTETDRFTRARTLFTVIDQTTFRSWNLPRAADDDGDGTTATAVLEQAGTGERVPLTFVQAEARWFLQAPSLDRLKADRDRLRAARAATLSEPLDGTGPHTPRDAMREFLLSFRYDGDGANAAALATLDLRGRPEVTRAHDGEVLAGYLKRVIDRTGYVLWQEIPDDPVSARPYVHFEHPAGNIVIAPVETDGGVIWQFTPETLRTIRRVYAAVEDMPVAAGVSAPTDADVHFAIRDALRGIAPGSLAPLGPLERWQWIALGATLFLMLAAAEMANRAARAFSGGSGPSLPEDTPVGNATVAWSLRGLAAGLVLFAANWALGLPDDVSEGLTTIATVLGVIALFLLGWIGIGALAERYRVAERVRGHNLILLSLASGVLRGLLLVVAVAAIAHMLSLPVTGVLAGFGIGGIAFALAVQPTLQNLLSGFTIFADRPISVGDFCRFGDKMGTVEHIGLRSTRLRTLDRTVISVPNSQFLDMELENYARRDRFLFSTTLGLRYETTPDQLRYVLAELRKLLIAHPVVVPEPLRVRFVGLGAHSLDVEIFSYILASDMDSFAAMREDLLLRIVATVDAAGTQFAFPSVVQYNADDNGLAADRIAEAEARVARWRDAGELPFPDFEWQSKAEMSGSLDYPPEGSAMPRGDGAD